MLFGRGNRRWSKARGTTFSVAPHIGDPGRRGKPIRTGRRDKPVIQLPSIALRVAVMVGIGVVLFAIILFRLWFLQILSGQSFVALANNNRLRPVAIVAPRGAIVDRHGEVIVQNRGGSAVGIRLMDVPEGQLDDEVNRLAQVMRMKPGKVRQRVKDYLRPSWPMNEKEDGSLVTPMTWRNIVAGTIVPLDLIVVKEDVTARVRSYIKEHTASFPGVEIRTNYLRTYPHGTFAAQLLGYVGEISADELTWQRFKGYSSGDVVGKSGLELTYDRWLRGRDGVVKVEVDAWGKPKAEVDAQGVATAQDPVPGGRLPEPGDTLVTTIDAKVQAKAEEALQYGIQLAHNDGKYESNGGAAVVLDAKNGQVIAMASNPTYDPELWVGGMSSKHYKALTRTSANFPLFNRPIVEMKAVGSTFKPITAIAGLEEGVITPYTGFYCEGSFESAYALDNHKFPCWASHGNLSVVGALTQSCDVFFYNVGDKFYARHGTELEDWATRLGMGKATGIDLPGEAVGRVPTPDWKKAYFKTEVDQQWTPGDSITLAVGQGNFEATPLQLAVAYAAIANGGTIVRPHVGLKIVDPSGKKVRDLEPNDTRKVDITRSTLDVVRRGLRDAASSGTGTSSAVFGAYDIAVAGKTGTAEVYEKSRGGNVDWAWYASYAPADDPEYVVVVMIEKGGHGATAAAPATRLIYDQLFGIKSQEFTGTVRGD